MFQLHLEFTTARKQGQLPSSNCPPPFTLRVITNISYYTNSASTSQFEVSRVCLHLKTVLLTWLALQTLDMTVCWWTQLGARPNGKWWWNKRPCVHCRPSRSRDGWNSLLSPRIHPPSIDINGCSYQARTNRCWSDKGSWAETQWQCRRERQLADSHGHLELNNVVELWLHISRWSPSKDDDVDYYIETLEEHWPMTCLRSITPL